MTFKNRLRSTMLNAMLSERLQQIRRALADLRRKVTGRPHTVYVFVELDDPYSYLLCNYLKEFRDYYAIDLRMCLTEALADEFRPAPQLLPEYVRVDCRRLADELGIPFLDRGATPPVEHRRALLAALVATAADADHADNVVQAITAWWRGDAESVARWAAAPGDIDAAEKMLANNQQLLTDLGHYNTATLHYGGEWYWGVDRLHYLIDRLNKRGAAKQPGLAPRIASIRQVMQPNLPIKPPAAGSNVPELEFFHSFRSPYSYLALERIFRIADAFGVRCNIRPVLPMVMRGMRVPKAKLLYIVRDASREARRNDVPFGRMADPVGVGVERLMAVFQYAKSQNKEREFVVQAGRAIWSNAVDVTGDEGLRKITAKVGLFWPDVIESLGDDSWRPLAEENRAVMMRAGSWGVPTVRIGDWVTWGQDRDWLVARHLEELCDSGEGILI
ncbi:MAG: 2-hydroxychromene-2-carboxylate isomerase [Woeseiaceae bacterium]|nr:2-hydroxychromene-2-carboxylate isomerase [Woeseiaceae bacterium]